MRLTNEELRALAFVGSLLVLASAARLARREPAVEWGGAAVDVDSLQGAARERLAEAERRARPLRPDERIDPNTAPEEELDRLPGVGPALARRIVAAREAGGPFRSLEELGRVRGVGPSTLGRLAPHLRLPPRLPHAATHDADGVVPTFVSPGSVPAVPTGRAAATAVPTVPAAGSAASAGPARPLDLNRATAAELETLPGIGPALAARLVAYRDSAGRFGEVDHIVRVRGIGPATLERLRPRLRVQP